MNEGQDGLARQVVQPPSGGSLVGSWFSRGEMSGRGIAATVTAGQARADLFFVGHCPIAQMGLCFLLEVPMLLIPDARRRLTLPPAFKPGQPIDLEPLADGTYRLVPMVAVPEHQMWAHRPEVQAAVEKALGEPPLSGEERNDFMRKLAQ